MDQYPSGNLQTESSEKKFINYYAGDGLQGNEFTRTAVFKDKRGKIFFGGTNGVTAFYPQDITEIKKEMNVLITGFHVANRPVKKGINPATMSSLILLSWIPSNLHWHIMKIHSALIFLFWNSAIPTGLVINIR